MYKAKYYLKTKKTPKGEHSKTYLYAKFNFRNEIASKDKANAQFAIDLISTGKCPEYFPNVDVLERVYDKGFFVEYFRTIGSTKIIGIRENFLSLKFSIKITAEGKVPLEEMLSLDALNAFVLQKK